MPVEVPILVEGEVERLEEKARDMLALANLGGEILAKLNELNAPKAVAIKPLPTTKAPCRQLAPAAQAKPQIKPAFDEKLSRPQQCILDALATFAVSGLADVARSNVAVWSQQSPKLGGLNNNLGALRSAGMIEYPSSVCVALTAWGSSHAEPVEALMTLPQLHGAWCSYLSGPQERIVRALIAIYPDAMP